MRNIIAIAINPDFLQFSINSKLLFSLEKMLYSASITAYSGVNFQNL